MSEPVKNQNRSNLKSRLTKFLLDILFPAFCAGCGKEDGFLCSECAGKIVVKRVPARMPRASGIKYVYAALDYRDKSVNKLITTLKYQGAREIAPVLVRFILEHLNHARFNVIRDSILIPVPLHKRRLAGRGFNQAELIAREIAVHFSTPVETKALKRRKNTSPQADIKDKKMRFKNVAQSFACENPGIIKGKTVVLVDDVVTTGATLGECAKMLRRAGARSVIAIAAAH